MKRIRAVAAGAALAGTLSLAGLAILDLREAHDPGPHGPDHAAEVAPAREAGTDEAWPQEQFTRVRSADFGALVPSADARRIADLIVRTGDHDALPFILVDKNAALLYVFDADGRVEAASPAILGIARGDRFAPGSAEKDMRETSEDERITPAGRFPAVPGLDDKGRHVVWIQYDAGISMHAVLDPPGERRRERLASPEADDNRISFGCVNLPTDFYSGVVRPLFERSRAIVYVLPDEEDALEFFATKFATRLASH